MCALPMFVCPIVQSDVGCLLQVTPLLGMLRDIKSCEDSAAAAETKLGSHTAYSGLPQSVHLIWAVRNRDELQLLDQDLLATAGYLSNPSHPPSLTG